MEMEMFYLSHNNMMKMPVMQEGRLYAALIDASWVRVQLIQYSSQIKVALCFYFYQVNQVLDVFLFSFAGDSFPGGLWRCGRS